MKKFLFATALLLSITSAYAQKQTDSNTKDSPAPADSKGFWVIESNINVRGKCIVYFYDNHQQLVYQENVEGRKLNVSKKKTQKQLNEILDKALANYAAKQAPATDMAWVATAMRK
jgi:hypothetical protein